METIPQVDIEKRLTYQESALEEHQAVEQAMVNLAYRVFLESEEFQAVEQAMDNLELKEARSRMDKLDQEYYLDLELVQEIFKELQQEDIQEDHMPHQEQVGPRAEQGHHQQEVPHTQEQLDWLAEVGLPIQAHWEDILETMVALQAQESPVLLLPQPQEQPAQLEPQELLNLPILDSKDDD